MAEELGFHPTVWLSSISKRLAELHAGRGGIEAVCQFLDQVLSLSPELPELSRTIKTNSLFFESAIGRCSRELLKRPLDVREQECFTMLGGVCVKCGTETSTRTLLQGKCPRCGSRLQPLYFKVLEEMTRLGMEALPEAVLMYVAYDRLAEAYVATYKAIRIIMEKTAEKLGWDRFRINKPELRVYLDHLFLGRIAGETKIPREEKELLQFIARGNLAGIDVEEAEKLIRTGMRVVKFGYLYQNLTITEAFRHFSTAQQEYIPLYNKINAEIEAAKARAGEEPERAVSVVVPRGGVYAPCFHIPPETWESGSLSSDIVLNPLYDLPIFPRVDMGSLQAIYGRLGSGKTFLLSSLACYSILSRREVVFVPLNDKSNSFTYACMPLFPYDRRTRNLCEILQGILRVEPAAVPVLILNVLRTGEKAPDPWKHPPTIYDRIIEVDNPLTFKVDFKVLLEELKGISEEIGYGDLRGIICVRNLGRFNPETKTDVDIQVATSLIRQFDGWRKGHPSIPMRVQIDEVAHLAPSAVYSGDTLHSGRTIVDFIKESRRNRVSIDICTQMPLEILPNVRDESTNVFFRNLATSRDKSRSQIDFLLDSLQLSEPEVKEVVRDLNNRGTLTRGYWFWYHQPTYSIEVIRPSPPTFCLHDPNRTAREVFRLYEKRFGVKLLLDSWRQVKRLEPESKGTATTIKDVEDLF